MQDKRRPLRGAEGGRGRLEGASAVAKLSVARVLVLAEAVGAGRAESARVHVDQGVERARQWKSFDFHACATIKMLGFYGRAFAGKCGATSLAVLKLHVATGASANHTATWLSGPVA